MKLFWCTLLLLVSCLEDNSSPESALKEYVDMRVGNVVNRSTVLNKVTGKMKLNLEHVTDAEFDQYGDLRNVKQDSFKIIDKSCKDSTCFLTYSISYKTSQNEKAAFNSEVLKTAELTKVEGKWFIADVTNIKTYHEGLEPLNALE
jgi:hypothetical protein